MDAKTDTTTVPEMPLRLRALMNIDQAQRVLAPAAERLRLVVRRSRRLAPRLLAQSNPRSRR